jgi:uncharacterized membrane protein YqhA
MISTKQQYKLIMKENNIFLYNTINDNFEIKIDKINNKTSKIIIEICSIIFIQNFIKTKLISLSLYYNIKTFITIDINNINLIKNSLDMNLKKL